jgi:hypothetical protein
MPSNQFVLISFFESRDVLSGGNPVGKTNTPLTINTGTHTFTLGQPLDYEPPLQKRKVANTSPASPLRLYFQKKPSTNPTTPT